MAVPPAEPVAQRREIDAPVRLLVTPVRNRRGMRGRRTLLPGLAVHRATRLPPTVMPDRTLRHAKHARHRALRMSLLQQYRHRRPRLIFETTHRPPPADLPPENRSGQGDPS
jgi:hypothetical protein